ncbi:hypothetical protein [Mesorhizobium sp. M1348]|uniref:hypothetical protein n=1 Tax=unclassified Mesorhizobium TaxID=325217 RepID=UPI003334F95A
MAIEPLAETRNRHRLRLDTLSADESFGQAGSGEVARDCLGQPLPAGKRPSSTATEDRLHTILERAGIAD